MIDNKLYVETAIKLLRKEGNFLVWWFPWNGVIRNKYFEDLGTLSTNVIEKLIDSGKLEFHSQGKGLLDHERYYVLKTLPDS